MAERVEREKRLAELRGLALQNYATLEHSLFMLFAQLSGMKTHTAAIVYFEIRNSRSLLKIIGGMLAKAHGQAYDIFWKSFSNFLAKTTEKRNKIVHWVVCMTTNAIDGKTDWILIPTDFWIRDTTPMHSEEIEEFIARCDFASRMCVMFRGYTEPQGRMLQHMDQAGRQTWHDIFQQAIVYPPPSTHPQYQNPPIPESQHPPSPGSQESHP